MYLQDGTRTHFMAFLEREFPALRPRFERLYRKRYPPDAYRDEVKAMVKVLQERYGLSRREANPAPPPEHAAAPEQAAFRW
jgi:hypothetical protein